jgi:ADP-heptose:LPS heptosyltransferase
MKPTIVRRLELLWRHRVVYPVLRLILRNKSIQLPVDLSRVRSILILRYDRLGDMIVTTPIFRILKQRYPGLRIGVFASELNAVLIRQNPNVDRVYVLHSGWFSLLREILRARRDGYGMVLNFIFNRTSSAGILANLISPRGIKIGQGAEQYRFYFNALLQLRRATDHMVETLASFLTESTGIIAATGELSFELHPDQTSRDAVIRFHAEHGLRPRASAGDEARYLIFNVSATDPVRRISWDQAQAISSHLGRRTDLRTVVISAPNDSDRMRQMVRDVRSPSLIPFPLLGSAPLLQVASLIEGAVVVITPDTGIIHFASAMSTPVLGFFTPLQGMHEWLPYGIPHQLVTADEGEPTAAIPANRLIDAIDSYLELLEGTERRRHL